MKPTLLIPAAGMGSRFGGLKQMTAIGPSGETLMDYSVFDAIRAGFGKVIFIIRHDFETEFRKMFNAERFNGRIEVDYAFQSIEKIPTGFSVNPERTKPWGAGHALLMAADLINEPFAVLNSDDFYGFESINIIATFLKNCHPDSNKYCMAGFRLGNTLSETGGVSRAICNINKNHELISIYECHQLTKYNSEINGIDESGNKCSFSENMLVSMNIWGFTPGFMNHAATLFFDFLKKNNLNLKAEFHIPFIVGELIKNGRAKVQAYETSARWIGVTWLEDREKVVENIKLKICKGEYPENLWTI
ncbi:MAG: NDP-sugar synthase [Bacteroidales bacterium]